MSLLCNGLAGMKGDCLRLHCVGLYGRFLGYTYLHILWSIMFCTRSSISGCQLSWLTCVTTDTKFKSQLIWSVFLTLHLISLLVPVLLSPLYCLTPSLSYMTLATLSILLSHGITFYLRRSFLLISPVDRCLIFNSQNFRNKMVSSILNCFWSGGIWGLVSSQLSCLTAHSSAARGAWCSPESQACLQIRPIIVVALEH